MKLRAAQIEKMADILEGIGQVMVASLVLPFLLEKFDPLLAATGLLLSLAAWGASLVILELKGDYI